MSIEKSSHADGASGAHRRGKAGSGAGEIARPSDCRKSLSLRASARREASALGVLLGMTGVRFIDTLSRMVRSAMRLSHAGMTI